VKGLAGFTDPAGRPVVGFGPLDWDGGDAVAELAVFFAGAGQDRDEPAAMAVDVVHCGPVAQFRVGHIQEVGSPDQDNQLVPGGDVGRVIGGVAVLDTERDRDGAVG
jgi:hypothetical protein